MSETETAYDTLAACQLRASHEETRRRIERREREDSLVRHWKHKFEMEYAFSSQLIRDIGALEAQVDALLAEREAREK